MMGSDPVVRQQLRCPKGTRDPTRRLVTRLWPRVLAPAAQHRAWRHSRSKVAPQHAHSLGSSRIGAPRRKRTAVTNSLAWSASPVGNANTHINAWSVPESQESLSNFKPDQSCHARSSSMMLFKRPWAARLHKRACKPSRPAAAGCSGSSAPAGEISAASHLSAGAWTEDSAWMRPTS